MRTPSGERDARQGMPTSLPAKARVGGTRTGSRKRRAVLGRSVRVRVHSRTSRTGSANTSTSSETATFVVRSWTPIWPVGTDQRWRPK